MTLFWQNPNNNRDPLQKWLADSIDVHFTVRIWREALSMEFLRSVRSSSAHFTRRILIILGRISIDNYTENDGANHFEIPPSCFWEHSKFVNFGATKGHTFVRAGRCLFTGHSRSRLPAQSIRFAWLFTWKSADFRSHLQPKWCEALSLAHGAKHSLLHIDLGKSLDLGDRLDLWCFCSFRRKSGHIERNARTTSYRTSLRYL